MKKRTSPTPEYSNPWLLLPIAEGGHVKTNYILSTEIIAMREEKGSTVARPRTQIGLRNTSTAVVEIALDALMALVLKASRA